MRCRLRTDPTGQLSRLVDPARLFSIAGLGLLTLIGWMTLIAVNRRGEREGGGNASRRLGRPRNVRRVSVLHPLRTSVGLAVTETAEKTDPALWDKIKHEVTEGGKGGKPGQWSARKAQLAVHDYKAAGGGYKGPKTEDNHLHEWTEEHWGTKSGKPSGETGERYLPEKAREHLSDQEYAATTAKKRADTKKGKQFSAQPKAIAAKTAQDRGAGARELSQLSRKALIDRAAQAKVAGRSRMNKDQLVSALSR